MIDHQKANIELRRNAEFLTDLLNGDVLASSADQLAQATSAVNTALDIMAELTYPDRHKNLVGELAPIPTEGLSPFEVAMFNGLGQLLAQMEIPPFENFSELPASAEGIAYVFGIDYLRRATKNITPQFEYLQSVVTYFSQGGVTLERSDFSSNIQGPAVVCRITDGKCVKHFEIGPYREPIAARKDLDYEV